MSVQIDELRPYKSLILTRLRESETDTSIVSNIIKDIEDLLEIDENPDLRIVTEANARTVSVLDQLSSQVDEIRVKYLHYEEKRAPSWYGGNEDLKDILNHLVVVCQCKRHVAIYLSDSRKQSAVTRQIGQGLGNGLAVLELIEPGLLNAAFVRGPARTVWLSGIHARVSAKADSKILSGIDLRDALDPLGDQTYYFTAARSSVPLLRLPVGVSPRKSRVWVGSSSDWNNFVGTVATLLRYLQQTTEPDLAPLPVVAIPAAKVPDLSEAFELHFLPPELLADDPDIDPEIRETMEKWAYRASFEIEEASENWLRAVVDLDDSRLGVLELVFDTSDPNNVKVESSRVKRATGAPRDTAKELERVSRKTTWIKVWYESGHTLADGAIFQLRHRDVPFSGFRWADFSGYDVKCEKFWTGAFPDNAVDLIGTRGSLFCWVRSKWANPSGPWTTGGWLACDDGAMEIADFIHLDNKSAVPTLSLIHVKGAKSNQQNRGISVSCYEVVTGQAIKNLRFLDRLCLDEGLRAGLEKKIGSLVWHDREPGTREEMLDAIEGIGTSYQRRVIVLQPHITRSKEQEVRADPDHRDRGRLRQLDTLLLGTHASCRSLGAEFIVLGDAI